MKHVYRNMFGLDSIYNQTVLLILSVSGIFLEIGVLYIL